MRVLAVPNWSFGRDRRLLLDCRDKLEEIGVTTHYAESDIDTNRTIMAFSGSIELIGTSISALSQMILPGIDLNRHAGGYPRIGGLDVCPIIALDPPKTKLRAQRLREGIEAIAKSFGETYDIPTFLYEKSETGRSEADLPALRKGGFGGLIDRDLTSDFGPRRAHPQLGVTVFGWRDFYIVVNVNLNSESSESAKRIARRISEMRADGDDRMLGVRAIGIGLPTKGLSQVNIIFTLPDLTPIDPVLEFVSIAADSLGSGISHCELVGVIRDTDIAHATRVNPRDAQIVKIGIRV